VRVGWILHRTKLSLYNNLPITISSNSLGSCKGYDTTTRDKLEQNTLKPFLPSEIQEGYYAWKYEWIASARILIMWWILRKTVNGGWWIEMKCDIRKIWMCPDCWKSFNPVNTFTESQIKNNLKTAQDGK
jgi:hypothetical protein